MKIAIEIDEARFNDIRRIAEVQIESSHFRTAEQIIAKGVPIEQEPTLDEIRAEIPKLVCCENEYRQALVKVADVIKCVDKHRAEGEE